MRSTTTARATGRLGAVAAMAALLLLVAAPAALADTSQASGRAATLQLVGQPLVDTGVRAASNDGSGETVTGPTSPTLGVLGGQNVLAAGVLAQAARANNDGTSAACAGAVGAGGVIQIGDSGECTAQNGAPGGVVVNLAPLTTLTADAIFASCTAASDGTTSATVSIVNGKVVTGLPGAQTTLLNLPLNAAPNTGLSIPSVVTLMLNEQPANQEPGSITTTALHLQVLGALNGGADLKIGEVTCGPNASTNEIPTFVAKGLPLSAAVVGVVGTVWFVRRRRTSAPAAV